MPADDSPTPIAELKLPPKQTMEYLVSTYCSSSFSLSFPIIDPVLFQHTLDAAYEPLSTEQPSKSVGAKACLFAFLSLKSKCGANWLFPPQMDGERYAAKAKSLVPEIFLEPSLVTFQTLFMLVRTNARFRILALLPQFFAIVFPLSYADLTVCSLCTICSPETLTEA